MAKTIKMDYEEYEADMEEKYEEGYDTGARQARCIIISYLESKKSLCQFFGKSEVPNIKFWREFLPLIERTDEIIEFDTKIDKSMKLYED